MNFFDASTEADLEPAGIVLAALQDRAMRCGVEIMVIGAAARDILIRHVLGTAPERATADIDIGVAVSSWADVDCLTGGLDKARGSVHTFVVSGVVVDAIPFGDIESDSRTIMWSNDHVMNVLGFKEALAAAVDVKLPSGVIVAVASLPSQSLLKLFAWHDRRHQSRRDAIDLRTILRAYSEGRYLDELYLCNEQLLAKHDFDPLLAGAERLGCEASAIIGSSNRAVVTEPRSTDDIRWHSAG